MDLWAVIKERYMLLSIFILIIVASLILVYATWRNRSVMPKVLTGFIFVLCTILIVISLAALVFSFSFGYNS